MKNYFFTVFLSIFFAACSQPAEPAKNVSEEVPTDIPKTENADFLTQAREIARLSQEALGSQLKAKMMQGGPIHALEFCSVEAIPITDSLSTLHGATIKRVSDQNRNPNNAANANELAYINSAKSKIAEGQQPEPTTIMLRDKHLAYVPIMTNGMCLQCHGEPSKTLSQQTFDKINELYPNDKAVGYGADQLRGIWVIEMMKSVP